MTDTTDGTEPSVRVVTRREAMKGTGLALGSVVASGALTERVLAQSGGPSDEISGIVEDGSGPVDGATVVAVPHDTSLAALETTTASDGTYIFEQSDLHTGSNLYHVIARDGIESDPRRGVPNYPFIAAEGPAPIPDSGLIHSWPIDSGSGTTLTDSTNDANISFNAVSWVSDVGFNGWVVESDGTDGIGTAASGDLQNWGDSGALLFCTHTSSWGQDGLLFHHSTADDRLFLWDQDTDFQVGLAGSGSAFEVSHPPASTWLGIGVTWDAGNAELYTYDLEDDSLLNDYSATYSGTMAQNGDLTMAGQAGASRYKAARWDVPLLYGAHKSQQQVTDWFSQIAPKYP